MLHTPPINSPKQYVLESYIYEKGMENFFFHLTRRDTFSAGLLKYA